MSGHVRRERYKPLFAAIAAQDNDLPPYDAVAEIRAMRAEKNAEDERRVAARPRGRCRGARKSSVDG